MPRRETKDDEQLVIRAFGSVNERQTSVELPPNEFSSIVGTFPDYLGQQGRIFGKRTLAKYADPIYGIWQFWMPYGYGVGLYEFDDHLDHGLWLTPSSKFPSLLLPPAIPFDGGGYTVDEFGNPYGGILDIGNPNVCILSFEELRTRHLSCGLSPTPSGTPDDSNGGPAGQGRNCAWQNVVTSYSVNTYATSITQGAVGYTTVPFNEGVNGACPAFPYPLPVPLPARQLPTIFTASSGVLNGVDHRQSSVGFGVGTPPCANQAVYTNEQVTVAYKVATFDFTSLLPLYENSSAILILTFQVSNFLGNPPAYDIGYEVVIDWTPTTGNYNAVVVNVGDYLTQIPESYAQNTGSNGKSRQVFITLTGFDIQVRNRVCS